MSRETYPPVARGSATRWTTGRAWGLIFNCAKWLLPLLCIYLVSASIAYSLDATVVHVATPAMLAPDGQSGSQQVNLESDLQDGPALGPGGFVQTASVN